MPVRWNGALMTPQDYWGVVWLRVKEDLSRRDYKGARKWLRTFVMFCREHYPGYLPGIAQIVLGVLMVAVGTYCLAWIALTQHHGVVTDLLALALGLDPFGSVVLAVEAGITMALMIGGMALLTMDELFLVDQWSRLRAACMIVGFVIGFNRYTMSGFVLTGGVIGYLMMYVMGISRVWSAILAYPLAVVAWIVIPTMVFAVQEIVSGRKRAAF